MILDLIRYADLFTDLPEREDALSREEIIAYLELILVMGLFPTTDTEVTLHSPGETADYRITKEHTVSAVSFESEDPEIAEVDNTGLITAVSPGETNVTFHYEGLFGPKDFVCKVVCDW